MDAPLSSTHFYDGLSHIHINNALFGKVLMVESLTSVAVIGSLILAAFAYFQSRGGDGVNAINQAPQNDQVGANELDTNNNHIFPSIDFSRVGILVDQVFTNAI